MTEDMGMNEDGSMDSGKRTTWIIVGAVILALLLCCCLFLLASWFYGDTVVQQFSALPLHRILRV
ncbi:MAG: hypothetical protein WBR18_10000 [Anaerolineales bacterium]